MHSSEIVKYFDRQQLKQVKLLKEFADSNGYTRQMNWKKIVQSGDHRNIQSIGTPLFMAYKNEMPTILKSIQDIKFTTLKQINVESNKIQSIEGFPRMNLPHLHALWFSSNLIVCIREFRKSNWPNMQSLGYNKNYINEGESSVLMECEKLTRNMVLQFSDDNLMMNSINWLAKMNLVGKPESAHSSIQVKFTCNKRIKCSSLQKCINRKNEKVKLICVNEY